MVGAFRSDLFVPLFSTGTKHSEQLTRSYSCRAQHSTSKSPAACMEYAAAISSGVTERLEALGHIDTWGPFIISHVTHINVNLNARPDGMRAVFYIIIEGFFGLHKKGNLSRCTEGAEDRCAEPRCQASWGEGNPIIPSRL